MKGVANMDEVLAIETQGLPADLPSSTYEMICRGAAINPSAPALSFFATADHYRHAECWTYSEFVRDVTRTANMFARLGVQRNSVIAYVLPNLPETHFVIWGGEAPGLSARSIRCLRVTRSANCSTHHARACSSRWRRFPELTSGRRCRQCCTSSLACSIWCS